MHRVRSWKMLSENIRVDDFREVFHPRAKRRKRTRRRYCPSQPVSSLRFIFVFSLLRFGGKRRIGRESRRKPAALPFQKQRPFHRSTRTDHRRHYRSLSLALFLSREAFPDAVKRELIKFSFMKHFPKENASFLRGKTARTLINERSRN